MKKWLEKLKKKLKSRIRLALTLAGIIVIALFRLVVVYGGNDARFVRVDYAPPAAEKADDSGKYFLSFDADVVGKMVKEAEIPLFYVDILGAGIETNPFLLNFPHGPAKMIRLNQISENPRVVRATFFLRRNLVPAIKERRKGLEVFFTRDGQANSPTRDSYTLMAPRKSIVAEPVPAKEIPALKIQVSKADPIQLIRELARNAVKMVHFRDPMLRQVDIDLSASNPVDAIAQICQRLNLAMSEEDGDIWVSNRLNPILKIPENHRVEGVDLGGLPLGDVLRALGQIAEVNIVLDASLNDIQGRQIQMYLKKMSVRRAVETLLQLHQLELKEIDEKSLLVMTRARARGYEGKVVRVVTPEIPLETLKGLLEKTIDKEMGERFSMHEDLGNLILVGDKEAVDSAQTLLNSMQEKVKKAGEGTCREYFHPINTESEDLIKMAKEVLSENENIKISFDKRTDMVMLIGADESVKRALEIIRKLDRPVTRQALIHIRLIEIHRTDLEEIGIKLPTTLARADDIGNLQNANYVIPAELVGYIEKTRVKTLANPTIRCMDKEEASIDISEQIPVKNTVTEYLPVASASLAARTSDNWTTSEVGIKMNVTPFIHKNDEITMEVDIDQTELVSLVEGHPWTAKRQIKTKVRMNNRETVVIGGLIRSKKDKSRKPVPILSKIPLIRNLVRRVEHNNDNEEKTELVVLITPALVGVEENDSTNLSMMPKRIEKAAYGKN